MRKWFRKFILQFIPHGAFADEEILSKHKLFITVCFITALFAFGYGVMSYYISYDEGLILMVIACIYFCFLPFLLKNTYSLSILANAAIALIGIIYFFLTWYSGGISVGPMDHWLLMLPILGMLVLNFRASLVWLIISVLISVVFFYLDFNGIKLPVEYPERYHQWFSVLSFIGIILILFFITSVFEAGKTDALQHIDRKNHELSETLKSLHQTQAQLIQHEKLAALGKMASGIAHEIENPLNFVNNFSDLSSELIEEIESETSEEERKKILADLKNYISKISHHGKKADSIVKGMLIHAQTGNRGKELTDINALCEQAFNLSFRSFSMKVPEFSCRIEKLFSEDVPKTQVIPQDISKVMLNLLNNAFYAIRKKDQELLKKGEYYKPQVSLITSLNSQTIFIKVKDNGIGMSESVKTKIFEPFFTTKPAGDGTGLGLSLCYDTIQAHGGDIDVESEDGKGSTFTITLPCSK